MKKSITILSLVIFFLTNCFAGEIESPQFEKIEVQNKNLKVQIAPVVGASGYRYYLSKREGTKNVEIVNIISASNVFEHAVQDDSLYTFSVFARPADKSLTRSVLESVQISTSKMTVLAPPEIKKITYSRGIHVDIKASPFAENYRYYLDQYINNTFQNVESFISPSPSHSFFPSEKTRYRIRVISRTIDGRIPPSSIVSKEIDLSEKIAKLDDPRVVSMSNINGKFDVTFAPVANAISYRFYIDKMQTNNRYATIDNRIINSTFFTSGQLPEGDYRIRIFARPSNREMFDNSKTISVPFKVNKSLTQMEPPKIISSKLIDNNLRISFSPSLNASGYRVYLHEEINGKLVTVSNMIQLDTYKEFSGLKKGSKYRFSVFARPIRDLGLVHSESTYLNFSTDNIANDQDLLQGEIFHTSVALSLEPTINNIGYTLSNIPSNITGAEVWYRKKGQLNWDKGPTPSEAFANSDFDNKVARKDIPWSLNFVDPSYGAITKRLHGSIFNLAGNSNYQVAIRLISSNGSKSIAKISDVKTSDIYNNFGFMNRVVYVGENEIVKTLEQAIASALPGDIIQLRPGLHTISKDINLSNISGTLSRPILVRGHPDARLENGQTCWMFTFSNVESKNIHFENLNIEINQNFRTGCVTKRVFYAKGSTENISIKNVNIDFKNKLLISGSAISFVGGFNKNLQIINNQIKAQDFTSSANNYVITVTSSDKLIFKGNDIRAGLTYDVAAFRGNISNADIYENHFEGTTEDDGVELEGGAHVNVRFYKNVIDVRKGFKGTISNIPVLVGPLYVMNNLIYSSQQLIKVINDTIRSNIVSGINYAKFGNAKYIHNTFINSHAEGAGFFRYESFCNANIELTNNIFVSPLFSTKLITGQRLAKPGDPNIGILTSENNLFWDNSTLSNPFLDLDFNKSSYFTNPDLTSDGLSYNPQNALLLPGINDVDGSVSPSVGLLNP
jgi:hypothetical protein